MPELIRLVVIGFALASAFVALLLGLQIASPRHLILEADKGWLGGVMLVAFNGIVLAGAQFGISLMRMAEPEAEDDPPGGDAPARRRGAAPGRGPGDGRDAPPGFRLPGALLDLDRLELVDSQD